MTVEELFEGLVKGRYSCFECYILYKSEDCKGAYCHDVSRDCFEQRLASVLDDG